MRSYAVTNPLTATKSHRYASYLRTPTRFIAEIHAVLSTLLLLCYGIAIIVSNLAGGNIQETEEVIQHRLGVSIYLCLALLTTGMDLALSILLFCAAKRVSREMCIFWWRCTLVTLIIFNLLTVCFAILVSSGLLLLAIGPNLIFKPFALYVVGGFIDDLFLHTRQKSPPRPLQARSDDFFTMPPSPDGPLTKESDDTKQTMLFYSDETDTDPDNVNNIGDTNEQLVKKDSTTSVITSPTTSSLDWPKLSTEATKY